MSWGTPVLKSAGNYNYSTPGMGNFNQAWTLTGNDVNLPIPSNPNPSGPFGGSGGISGHWILQYQWSGPGAPGASFWYTSLLCTTSVNITECSYAISLPVISGSTFKSGQTSGPTPLQDQISGICQPGSAVHQANGVYFVTFSVGTTVQVINTASPDMLFAATLEAIYQIASAEPFHL